MRKFNVNQGDLHSHVSSARNILLNFQASMPPVPSCAQFEEERKLRQNLTTALHNEEVLLKQKSRINWLQNGDNNNKFFYNSCKGRWNTNRILSIEDDQGQTFNNHKDISRLTVGYFKDLLGSPTIVEDFPDDIEVKSLSEDQQNYLITPFQPNDVLKTLKSMGKNKCPGPDGFPVEFYLQCWNIVGLEVVNGILYFFNTLHMPRIINSTALALIPKHTTASNISHYRPISCCNVIYKCISKNDCRAHETPNAFAYLRLPISFCSKEKDW